MFLTGVAVARSLGPAGKGLISTMGYLAVLLGHAATFGLGDAGIVRIGQGRASMRTAVRSSLIPVLLMASLAFLLFTLGWRSYLDDEWQGLGTAVLLIAVSIPAWTLTHLFSSLMEARGRAATTSVVHVVMAGSTALATLTLVSLLRHGLDGAALAASAGPLLGALVLAGLVYKQSRGLDTTGGRYLSQALRLGIPIQAATVMSSLAARIDVVIVFALLGGSAAGRYSVAVTVGQLILYAPLALSKVSFPAIAHMDEQRARAMLGRVARLTMVLSTAAAAALLLIAPWVIPWIFGPGFAASVQPALILLLGGIPASLQWVIARGLSARDRPRALFASYGTGLVTMIVLDLLLIAPLGLHGAALASSLAAATGLAVALRYAQVSGIGLSSFVPGTADLRTPWPLLRTLVSAEPAARDDKRR